MKQKNDMKEYKNCTNSKRKRDLGITLIALVITIALNCYRSGRKEESVA